MFQLFKNAALSVCWLLLLFGTVVRASIYEWKYIDPADPSQGKEENFFAHVSSTDPVPGAYYFAHSLRKAYLIGVDLTDANLERTVLIDADFTGAKLTRTAFERALMTNTTLTDADVRYAKLWDVTRENFTAAQLYSTASYKAQDLTGLQLNYNNLSSWDFSDQNLTNASFYLAQLTITNFAGATVRGTNFSQATSRGFTTTQLYSTASYLSQNMTGINLASNNLNGWDFSGQNLSDGYFYSSQLDQTDFSGAHVTGADFSFTMSEGFTSAQLYSTASYQAGDLHGIVLSFNDLTELEFAGFNLADADFHYSILTDTDFTNASIRGADFSNSTELGFTEAQLTSTASYRDRDLVGIHLNENDLSGWDFSNQDLTDASFSGSDLTDTDFTGANIRGASFAFTVDRGFTAEKLYSTASYQNRDLPGVAINGDEMSGWNFDDQNLEGAYLAAVMTGTTFRNAYLANASFAFSGPYMFPGTDFTGADLRGAEIYIDVEQTIVTNTIDSDGIVAGLDLTTEHKLVVRDHDGYEDQYYSELPIAIHIEQGVAMNTASVLELRFDADEWNSTISFEAGIAVTLDGILQLGFADDVNITSQIGRTLDLFDWTGVSPTGLFTVASDYEWDLANLYTTGEVTLLSVLALPGDFDGDGDVDGRDFLAWQRNPIVGSLAAWQANYGDAVGSLPAFAAVPEPAGVALAALMLMGGAVRGPLRCAGAPRRG